MLYDIDDLKCRGSVTFGIYDKRNGEVGTLKRDGGFKPLVGYFGFSFF